LAIHSIQTVSEKVQRWRGPTVGRRLPAHVFCPCTRSSCPWLVEPLRPWAVCACRHATARQGGAGNRWGWDV